MNQSEFENHLREKGYGPPRFKKYEPESTCDMHSHDFSVLLLVVDGEFILAKEHGSERFRPGQVCSLEAGVVHAEQAGSKGATIILGTK